MYLNLFYGFIFLTGVFFLLEYRYNIGKAAKLSKNARYPASPDEFSGILIPNEWKEMVPLSMHSKSFQKVKWGTVAALLFSVLLLVISFTVDQFDNVFLSVAYLFFVIVESIQHPGNLYIVDKGIILNGRYVPTYQITSYRTEKIVRWHPYYGLDARVDNGFILKFSVKRSWFKNNFVVIENLSQLEAITAMLDEYGITGVHKEEQQKPAPANG